MAKLKKATVKFQKNKLKNTIERRKKHTKFKQQVNRRKERRSRNQENGKGTASRSIFFLKSSSIEIIWRSDKFIILIKPFFFLHTCS